MHCKTELALWATNCWLLQYWNLKSFQYLKLFKSLWLVSLRRIKLQGNWIQQVSCKSDIAWKWKQMFSFLKALCNVHWMENCRGWLLLLPLACFTFHRTSKANMCHRNLTAIHLTVLPLFRTWTYWLMLQIFTLPGSLLFNCVVKNLSFLLKSPLLIIVWQFTRIEAVPLLIPCSPLKATGEQVWKVSSVIPWDPITNQGWSTMMWTASSTFDVG